MDVSLYLVFASFYGIQGTVDETMGDYEELYLPIEKDKLRDIFGL